MKPGLITLADLPALAAGKNRTTIVVARLDDRLRDPRYGAFKITQADVDGWTRNLANTFGGRVAIDYDHSSDRGQGTRAAAWITGLHQDGKLVTADVEFTPRGAKSVRNGDYAYISPTFVADYTDEHGEKHGRALIGAALTNRPVLRKGMPCLSLSRDAFDGVATPRNQRRKNGSAMSTTDLKTLSRTTSKDAILRALPSLSRKQVKKLTKMVLDRPSLVGPAPGSTSASELSAEAVVTLAQFAPAGIQHAGTIDWDPPATGPGRMPPGLDDSGKALHALIAARAAKTGKHYFHAMADVTRQPSYRELSDLPTTPVQQPGLDPERMALDNAARALSVSAGISWIDACNYLVQARENAPIENDTGAGSVPWLDSRPLASPPRPWSDEDWERDQRRAAAAGLTISKPAWQAGAEQGRDVVGEEAEQQRQEASATVRQRSEGMLDQARAAEDTRRSSAINDELLRQARNRAAGNGRPASRR
jgi:hypothetical protein